MEARRKPLKRINSTFSLWWSFKASYPQLNTENWKSSHSQLVLKCLLNRSSFCYFYFAQRYLWKKQFALKCWAKDVVILLSWGLLQVNGSSRPLLVGFIPHIPFSFLTTFLSFSLQFVYCSEWPSLWSWERRARVTLWYTAEQWMEPSTNCPWTEYSTFNT